MYIKFKFNRGQCPGEVSRETEYDSALGMVPHQIRGFLATFNNILVSGQAYEKCPACSEKVRIRFDLLHLQFQVTNAFRADGVEFVISVVKSPKLLEELTGCDELDF